jgi:hypothetical protein
MNGAKTYIVYFRETDNSYSDSEGWENIIDCLELHNDSSYNKHSDV